MVFHNHYHVYMSIKSTMTVSHFRRDAHMRPFCGRYIPSMFTSAKPTLRQICNRFVPYGQIGIMSQKLGCRNGEKG